jgi:hypothetical protein
MLLANSLTFIVIKKNIYISAKAICQLNSSHGSTKDGLHEHLPDFGNVCFFAIFLGLKASKDAHESIQITFHLQ